MIKKKTPRWINEIPKPSVISKKRELTEEEKKEAKEFKKAIEEGKIDDWFNETGEYKK